MKKIVLLSGLLFFAAVAAAHQSYVIMSMDEPTNALLPSDELPVIPQEMRNLAESRRESIKDLGYIPMYSKNAELLMSMKDKKGTAESLPEDIPYFYTLRLNTVDFNLTFPFKSFPSIAKENLIGFVPSGSYEDETGKWTGLTAYFNNEILGVCRLELIDMPAINGQSFYEEKFVNFDINKKPTFTTAQGNDASGFIYEASWTGKRYEKTLECANKKPFSRGTMKDLIVLSKKIDKDLPDPVK
jgi:hypothetical protein